MVIISQNKASVINFDNVFALKAILCGDDGSCSIIATTVGNYDKEILGIYSTEKRAMDVLDKLVNARGLGMYAYTMPKK